MIQEERNANVPTQLIDPDDLNKDKEVESTDEKTDGIKEFSGCGAVAGYTGPLGINPDALGRKKNKRK